MATTTRSSTPPIPLTTTFTRPAACEGIYKPEPRTVFMIDDQPACLPSGFAIDEDRFYSPGIACPSGYWTACLGSSAPNSLTTVTCCPVFGGSTTLSCHRNPETLGTRWESLFCTWQAPRAGAVMSFTESSLGPTVTGTTTLTAPQGVNAYGIRMLYQSTDLVASSSADASTSTSNTSSTDTDTGVARPTSPLPEEATNNDTNTDTNGVLSQAGTIAVAVVIPVIALLAAAGFFLWWRRRRAPAAEETGPQELMAQQPRHPHGQPGDFNAKLMPSGYGLAELSGAQVGAELSDVHSPVEMPVHARRYEMG